MKGQGGQEQEGLGAGGAAGQHSQLRVLTVCSVFTVSRCATPAHDKWICTDPGESSPAPERLRGVEWAGEGSGSVPGSPLCQLSLRARVPQAHLAQLCCCLLFITAHPSCNLGLSKATFSPI